MDFPPFQKLFRTPLDIPSTFGRSYCWGVLTKARRGFLLPNRSLTQHSHPLTGQAQIKTDFETSLISSVLHLTCCLSPLTTPSKTNPWPNVIQSPARFLFLRYGGRRVQMSATLGCLSSASSVVAIIITKTLDQKNQTNALHGSAELLQAIFWIVPNIRSDGSINLVGDIRISEAKIE